MNLKNTIFYLGIGTLFTHELDAMMNHEWRVLPLTNCLPDGAGATVFLFSHVPLFAIVIALLASTNEKIRSSTRVVISAFLIIHGLLHALFIGGEAYEFASSSSNVLIFGGAALGLVYLIIEFGKIER